MKGNYTEFMKAAALGGFAATGALIAIEGVIHFTLASLDALPTVLIVWAITWLVATVITLLAAVVIGLPLTAMLRRFDCENRRNYAFFGSLFGFLIPLVADYLVSDKFNSDNLGYVIAGTLAGTTAGFVWGNWREQVALEQVATEAKPPRPDRGERWLR